MQDSFEIVKLQPNDWEAYKNLRLKALKEDPEAFGSSYEEEVQYPKEKWIENINNTLSKDNHYLIFAKIGNKLVGMIGAYQNQKNKLRHVGVIFGVYVAKEARRKGVGRMLIESILHELGKSKEILKVEFGVNANQASALELYKKSGFKIVGKFEKQFNVGGKYYDEYMMEKFLR